MEMIIIGLLCLVILLLLIAMNNLKHDLIDLRESSNIMLSSVGKLESYSTRTKNDLISVHRAIRQIEETLSRDIEITHTEEDNEIVFTVTVTAGDLLNTDETLGEHVARHAKEYIDEQK